MTIPKIATLGALFLGAAMLAAGQSATASSSDALETLRVQLEKLRAIVVEINEQLAGSRRETLELRRELQGVRQQLEVGRSESVAAPVADQSANPSTTLEARV